MVVAWIEVSWVDGDESNESKLKDIYVVGNVPKLNVDHEPNSKVVLESEEVKWGLNLAIKS